MLGPGRLVEDFFNLQKHIASFSNKQAKVVQFTDDITHFVVEVTPNGGLYNRGRFLFRVSPGKNYPNEAPQVLCETMIFHPNIDSSEDGQICLDLFDEWAPKNDLEDCVQGLLFLLHNPNLEDPLNPWFNPEDDYDEFAENVFKSLQGECVEDVQFERNVVEVCEDDSGTHLMTDVVTDMKNRNRHVEQNHDVHSLKLADKMLDIQTTEVPLIFLETADGQHIQLQL